MYRVFAIWKLKKMQIKRKEVLIQTKLTVWLSPNGPYQIYCNFIIKLSRRIYIVYQKACLVNYIILNSDALPDDFPVCVEGGGGGGGLVHPWFSSPSFWRAPSILPLRGSQYPAFWRAPSILPSEGHLVSWFLKGSAKWIKVVVFSSTKVGHQTAACTYILRIENLRHRCPI